MNPESQTTTDPTATPTIDDVLGRLAALTSSYAAVDRRIRFVTYGLVVVALLAGFGLIAGTLANNGRVNDIQSVRRAAILYTCRQQNAAHIRTVVFLDTTELKQLHTRPLLATYPTIEVQTLRAIRRLHGTKRTRTLANHRLLLNFIDNLAPHEHCAARVTRLSTGR